MAKCSDCGQTVNASRGQKAPIHRRKGENKKCDGSGEPTK